ncbi:protein zwilch [Tribolium castaneum]|uniref:Protein zwilch n=1 Tax=Tribolium castaneum TaxID=7070 RepID=D6WK51_TRICA|nr:PREDICTED: protein zwilch [Tribolium castaneum]EFA04506.2 hypothetical protein TcasGA2_TC014814 [Tribolium castaneum]|eukprot:XP_008194175.1 PREDICTED: protein zwilch [Tribolium castaneum]
MSVKVITTKQPSYLEALLQENCNLKLVYHDKKAESAHVIASGDESNIPDVSELDLTGHPLQVDLGGDDVIENGISEKPANWSSQEASQFPLTFSEGRTFINKQLRLGSPNESIYCICDGSDEEKTVGLGVVVAPHKNIRTLVRILPCCEENSEQTSLEHLQNEFLKLLGDYNADVKICIKKTYNLFGYNLKNCHALQNAECNGNITLDVLTVEKSKFYKSNHVSKMNFQVIIGHNNSRIRRLFEELCLVQSYIAVIQNNQQLNANTIINCEDGMDYSDITSKIVDLLRVQEIYSERPSFNKLDLENLRETSIFDKLWDILKHCKSVGDLHDCFQLFFEELEVVEARVGILEGCNDSTVAELVKGILDDRVVVTTLSLPQCLEFLIDLGLVKLKNDYLAIITSFPQIARDGLLKMWSDFKGEDCVNIIPKRKSRVTINSKSVISDMTSSKLKLFFLDSLHKVSELMLLYRDNLPVSDENFDAFCRAVCDKFIDRFERVIVWIDLKQLRLCQVSGVPSIGERQFLQNNSPSAFAVKMNSVVNREEITAVYHFSDFLILPPCVYDNYEVSCEKDSGKMLYVTQLLSYNDCC